MPDISGREVVLAGSCSMATREQISRVLKKWPSQKVDIDALAKGHQLSDELSTWASEQTATTPILIYASADPKEVAEIHELYGMEQSGQMIEKMFGELAKRLVKNGFRRIIVAGGETSGAVVSSLGIKALRIGPEIDPGVPWTESLEAPNIALTLKSGNFGEPDFFTKAFKALL